MSGSHLTASLGCSAYWVKERVRNFSMTPSPNMYVPPPTGGVLFLGFLYGKRRRRRRGINCVASRRR